MAQHGHVATSRRESPAAPCRQHSCCRAKNSRDKRCACCFLAWLLQKEKHGSSRRHGLVREGCRKAHFPCPLRPAQHHQPQWVSWVAAFADHRTERGEKTETRAKQDRRATNRQEKGGVKGERGKGRGNQGRKREHETKWERVRISPSLSLSPVKAWKQIEIHRKTDRCRSTEHVHADKLRLRARAVKNGGASQRRCFAVSARRRWRMLGALKKMAERQKGKVRPAAAQATCANMQPRASCYGTLRKENIAPA